MTSIPLDNAGGSNLIGSQYVRLTQDIVNRIGSAANVALFNLVLGRLLSDDGANLVSGVVGDDLKVTEADGLVSIAPGFGMFADASATDTHAPSYRPVVVDSIVTLPLDEADPVDDRIDIVSVAPDDVDDVPETVWVRGSSGLGPVDLPTRRRFSASVTLTKGTPGAGVPATPSGHMKLAEVTVLAADAGVEVVDCRPILNLNRVIRPVPGEGRVVEGLEPSMVGVTGAAVEAGIAEIDGYRYRFQATGEMQPTHNAGAPSRYDLLLAKTDGTIELVEGTTTQPTDDDVPAGALLIGVVVVKGASAGVQAVIDRREFGSIGAAQLRAGAVVESIGDGELPGAKLETGAVTTAKIAAAARPVYPKVTYEGNDGLLEHYVSIQITDAAGFPVAREVSLLVAARDTSWGLASGQDIAVTGGGSVEQAIQDYLKVVKTGPDGSAELTITNGQSPADGMIHLDVTTRNAIGGNALLSYSVAP